jgi:hypothetical protein
VHDILEVRNVAHREHVFGAGQEKHPEEPPIYTLNHKDTYETLQCRGCESISLSHLHEVSLDEEDGWERRTVHRYPPPVSRPAPKWAFTLPDKQRELLNEIYASLHADGPRLALMGARALVDMVLTDKVEDVGTFKEKLKRLQDQGFVGKRNREILGAALDAGHAATHRGHRPDEKQLGDVMDIVENLLQTVYVLEVAAAKLKKTTPPRKGPPRR